MNIDKGDTILGVGIDLIEIDRIRESLKRHQNRMEEKLFTDYEREYCERFQDSIPHYAARFAAKEAIAKAVGTGFGDTITWQGIEIQSEENGKPYVVLSPELTKKLPSCKFHLSFSHSATHVVAIAIWVKRD